MKNPLPQSAYQSAYIALKCMTCNMTAPACGTRPGELIHPDYDDMEEQVGETLTNHFKQFVAEHEMHDLREVPA